MTMETGYAVFMDENILPQSLLDTLHQLGARKVDTRSQSSDFVPVKAPDYWVVIVDAETPVSPEYIKAHISLVPRQTATLLVLVGNPNSWPTQLIHCCHDFVRWPCGQEELKIRLSRFGHAPEPVFPATDNTTHLMQQVANLNLVGRSESFTRSLDLIQKFAACDAPVFINGEAGTEKDLVARAIHYMSERRGNAFLTANSATLTDNLAPCGIIGQAQGGTLFLDEVDKLSSKNQIALLKILQEQSFLHDAPATERKSNIRIIVATNLTAEALSSREEFRKDLFYQLHILAITLPPLRQRKEDIHLLANHFVKRLNRKYRREKVASAHLISWMEQQYWEGNVKELENFIHRNYLMSDSDLIVLSSASPKNEATTHLNFNEAKHRLIEQFEKSYLIQLLKETHGNISEAARRAGKERRALGKMVKKYGIEIDCFRNNPLS